ncbi:hypothetical protein BI364_03735 [Acidihalobacter yilgarnensis]|uniref:Thioredoxin domain-containing protein n=2 Tax=Acidihalobacter yilgarnensis TaxID=2819280 RepID=A0A1D8ILC2_9GAMM|nr:hypothetical protein BI364_03735 [Acidihalobacter yilgarnensis]
MKEALISVQSLSNQVGPVLCAPCRIIGPMIAKLADDPFFTDKLRFVKVNLDANPQLHRLNRIRGIPDVRIYIDGEVVDSFTGVIAENELRAFVAKWLPH